MSIDYTWEKLYRAIRGMAASEGTPRERLIDAYSALLALTEADFPERMQPAFTQILRDLAAVESTGDGAVAASVPAMTAVQVHRTIESLIDLYDAVCRSPELQAAFPHD